MLNTLRGLCIVQSLWRCGECSIRGPGMCAACFLRQRLPMPNKSDVKKLLKRNEQLNQLDMARVVSHVQRPADDWIQHSIMLEGYDVPFKYLRKKRYRSLVGARVNVTYYPRNESVGGIEFETMRVVRIYRS